MGYPAQIKGIGQYTLSNIASALITYPVTALPGDYVVIIAVTGGPTSITNNYTLTNPSGWTKYGHISYRYIQSPENSVIIATGDGNAINITWVVIVLRPSETVQGPVWYTAQSVNGVTQLAWAERSNDFRSRRLIAFGAAVTLQPNSMGLFGATYAGSGYTGGTYNRGLMVGYIDLLPNAPMPGLWTFGAPTNVTPDYIGFITDEVINGVATVRPSSSVTAAGTVVPWSAAVQIAPQAQVTAKDPRITPFGVAVSYVASTDGTDAGSVAACLPGTAGGVTRRALLRFPVWGEFPPLARVTSVELKGAVTAAGGAGGTWAIAPYRDGSGSGAFADPEQDTFATQHARAGAAAAAPYLTTTAFRTAAPFQLDLGAQAVDDFAALNTPVYGFVPLCIVETSGSAAAPTLESLSLVVRYNVPRIERIPLHELVSVTLMAPGVPPVPAAVDISDYALRVRMRWQGPGDFTLTIPSGSSAAAALADMGLVLVRIAGVPVFCGVQEQFRLRRTRETGRGGVLIEVSGQSLHRFLGSRITGPFPGGMNHAEQPYQTSIGTDVEVISVGDPSPRGAAFGPASSSAESVLRKLLVQHTIAADPARRTVWTNNLRFAPDGRRGVTTGTTISTRLQPLLAEAEKLCHRADCGHEVLLAPDGTFRWFFLPGANRTGEQGRWFLSADLTPGVEEVEVTRDSTQLVTHVYLAGAGTGATRTLGLYRQQQPLDAIYDRREAAVDGANATSDAAAALYATAYLSQHLPRRSVTLSLTNLLDSGWLSAYYLGDQLTVVDPDTGVSEVQRVYEIELVLGSERQVRAVLGSVVDPAVTAILEPPDGGSGGDGLVAVGTVVTAPSPLPGAGTWKETSPSALA